MAAAKANYIICYKQSAQVYSATNLKTALNTPVPKGCVLEDRRILFMSFLPDEEQIVVYLLTDDQLKVEEKADVKENTNQDSAG